MIELGFLLAGLAIGAGVGGTLGQWYAFGKMATNPEIVIELLRSKIGYARLRDIVERRAPR